MLLHMHFFGPVVRGDDPNGYRVACDIAFKDFANWKRLNKITCSARRFCYWTFFKEEYGAYMNTKGFIARVISAWLGDVLKRAVHHPPVGMLPDDRLDLCLATVTPDG